MKWPGIPKLLPIAFPYIRPFGKPKIIHVCISRTNSQIQNKVVCQLTSFNSDAFHHGLMNSFFVRMRRGHFLLTTGADDPSRNVGYPYVASILLKLHSGKAIFVRWVNLIHPKVRNSTVFILPGIRNVQNYKI